MKALSIATIMTSNKTEKMQRQFEDVIIPPKNIRNDDCDISMMDKNKFMTPDQRHAIVTIHRHPLLLPPEEISPGKNHLNMQSFSPRKKPRLEIENENIENQLNPAAKPKINAFALMMNRSKQLAIEREQKKKLNNNLTPNNGKH
jgi:hypothetical protein